MASTNLVSSLSGFVSSKRKLHLPPFSSAIPKSRQKAFACPMCRHPLGSGGKRVCTADGGSPSAMSCAIIWRIKCIGLSWLILCLKVCRSVFASIFFCQRAPENRRDMLKLCGLGRTVGDFIQNLFHRDFLRQLPRARLEFLCETNIVFGSVFYLLARKFCK